MPLSKKQRRVLEAIIFLTQRGDVPTVREVAEMLGLRSPATVMKHLKTLQSAGLIEMSGKSRGIRVLRGAGIPVVGRIAAGEPIENVDAFVDAVAEPGCLVDVEGGDSDGGDLDLSAFGFEEIPIDPRLFCPGSAPGDLVALRVHGESMIGAGIFDGDLVVIRRQPTVEEGEIAAVLVDGEGTLKRWQTAGGSRRGARSVRLAAENERFEPIVVSAEDHKDVRVFGRYVGLIRGEGVSTR